MSGRAFVTTHAARQYQRRIAGVAFERAKIAIHDGLRHPTAYLLRTDQQGRPCLWLGIGGRHPFIAVVIGSDDSPKPLVVTVLPARWEQQRGCPIDPPRWECQSRWKPIRTRRPWEEMLGYVSDRQCGQRRA